MFDVWYLFLQIVKFGFVEWKQITIPGKNKNIAFSNRKDAKTKNRLIYSHGILWLFYTSKAAKPCMEFQKQFKKYRSFKKYFYKNLKKFFFKFVIKKNCVQ